mgnify:CR=1 FL=1
MKSLLFGDNFVSRFFFFVSVVLAVILGATIGEQNDNVVGRKNAEFESKASFERDRAQCEASLKEIEEGILAKFPENKGKPIEDWKFPDEMTRDSFFFISGMTDAFRVMGGDRPRMYDRK